MAGKYSPLSSFLKSISASQKDVTLTFDKIEEVLCDKLPKSSRQYTAWWNNERDGAHVQAHSWMDVGWQVESLNLVKGWVRFIRKK